VTISRSLSAIAAVWAVALLVAAPHAQQTPPAHPAVAGHDPERFQTAENCVACHNGLVTPSGEDVSIGASWRASMMANSARDPYWQAAVRRETIDHPSVKAEIENECSICHMPMATSNARLAGGHGEVFAHLPIVSASTPEAKLAADGVSCTLCHQIGTERLGSPESFTGGFVVNPTPQGGQRRMFGPYAVDEGRTALMRSATGVTPTEASHVRESALCATCHTLFTQAFDGQGRVVGRLAEQVPYLEWRHSAFRSERSCQSCHMPPVKEPTRVSSVLGEPREDMGRHTFLGGNFFMLRLLNRFRLDLGVTALPLELDAAATATIHQLQHDTATVAMDGLRVEAGRLSARVRVSNLTGHKLPTGYPARRAWLHLVVRDASGRTVFESGALQPSGAIAGNDLDADGSRYEPHYDEIRAPDQVQIYESVMTDANGRVTTGLLSGTQYVKDNRLLPRGFDKAAAEADIAVHGDAASDPNFGDLGDQVLYSVDVGGTDGPLQIEVELRYQPIAFRWAENLRRYEAAETRRFVGYYESMSAASSVVVATATSRTR
jgi:hypothetical protein